MTTVEPVRPTSSPPPLLASTAVDVDNDDKNDDVRVTSPADDKVELVAKKKKTRKKRISCGKSEETDKDTVAAEPVDKGSRVCP